jgi:TolB-like protein
MLDVGWRKLEDYWRGRFLPLSLKKYKFDTWEVIPANVELRRAGMIVHAEPQTFQIILHLVANHDRVVSKSELLSEVWKDRAVSDWAVSAGIKAARIVLGDTQTPRRFIQTIHSRGFRFIAKVESESEPAPSVPIPDAGLSLIVQPFKMHSADPNQSYFADGLSEDLITDLSQTPGLRVATRHECFALGESPQRLSEMADELGVTHVLEGSVRREDDRVRINAQLSEITSGLRLWTDRFTALGDEIFDLQDQLCQAIVESLRLHISSQAERRETRDIRAYDCCLQGRSAYYQYTPEHMAKALNYFEQAGQIDPNYAAAFAYQSYCRTALHVFSWPHADATLDPALSLAERALVLNPHSAVAHARLGWVLSYLDQPDRCVSSFERACALDSQNAEVNFAFGESLNRLCQPDRALRTIELAFGIESYVPPSWEFARGHAHAIKKNYSDAIERLSIVMDRLPNFVPALVQLTRVYAEIGQRENAVRLAEAISKVAPNYQLAQAQRMFPYPDETEKERLNLALTSVGFT